MKIISDRMRRLVATALTVTLLSLSLGPGVAAACEGGGTANLSISASPTSVTIPKSKSTITITNINPTEKAVIKKVEAEEKENSSQWSFNVSECNGKELEPFQTCKISVTYIGELKSKVTFVALDEHELSSGTATVTATPAIQTEPGALAFGSVTVGTEVKKKLKIKANETVSIKTIKSTGAVFKIVTDSCSTKTFEAGKECEIEVGFLPAEKKVYANTLEVPYEIVSTKANLTREIAMTGEGS